MPIIYNTNPTKKRRLIPRSRDVIYKREYGNLTYELCVQNINSLLISFQAVFRSLVSVSIEFDKSTPIPKSWGVYVATVTIQAINPKTKTLWVQSFEFSTIGAIVTIDRLDYEIAWAWKSTYHRKCTRALDGWLKDIQENRLSKQRTLERNGYIKEELMQIVYATVW